MPESFYQYSLIKTLSKKYSHTTYLASPTNEPTRLVVLTVFAVSLFCFPRERKDLLQKIRRIQQLQHPYLLPILDMGVEEEQPFVVWEYLPNGSLRDQMKKTSPNRLEQREALMIVSRIGQTLIYAHENNIIHGNLKPENILLDADGQAILIGFNFIDRKDITIHDQTSEEYAFCYMAPEQFTGTINTKSDQYALGCLAYELITGHVPFAAQTLASMIGGPENNGSPTPPSESVPSIHPFLEAAILTTLAKDPSERFFDLSLFLEVIQSALPPSPIFHSLRKRTVSHAVQSAKTKELPSSTSDDPSSYSSLKLQKASETLASSEFEAAEPIQDSTPEPVESTSFFNLLESALQSDQRLFPLAEEAHSINDEEEENDLFVNDAFIQQLMEAEDEEVLLPTGNYKRERSPWHNRIKKLAVLLSMIMVVAISAFWVYRMSASDTNLQITKKMAQAITIRTINVLTTQTTKIATVQPTAQATAIPTVHPIPASITMPKPIPTPTPPISYQASTLQNTLASGARVVDCSVCSEGKRVAYIGLNAGVVGTLQFNNVSKNIAGQYTLTIYYIMAGSDKPTTYIRVNGGSAIVLNVSDLPNGDTIGTASVTISLKSGNNTIEFYNPANSAPDMDRIVV